MNREQALEMIRQTVGNKRVFTANGLATVGQQDKYGCTIYLREPHGWRWCPTRKAYVSRLACGYPPITPADIAEREAIWRAVRSK